ncbi:MAG TPA: SPOR domain-containing protein [Steroidobacteraceae bacterium]|jgi:cell division septation protein DedD|nr:SPOR domain-containing protein [Steroidobacteraceae bacterium]
MENRLKERLTGAAILVALIVLVVPEMFHGPRSAAPAGQGSPPAGSVSPAGAAAEGPPVRSYTIDLSGAGASSAPLQSDAPAAPAAPAAPDAAVAGNQGAPADAVTALPGPTVSSGSAIASESPPASGSSPTPGRPPAPKRVAVPRRAAVAKRVAVARSPAAPPETSAPKTSAAPSGPSGWSVQLGLFANGENAQRLARTAHAKGFSTHISRTEPRGLYRVWVAGLSDRSAAEQLLRKLHAAGLPAAVMRPR